MAGLKNQYHMNMTRFMNNYNSHHSHLGEYLDDNHHGHPDQPPSHEYHDLNGRHSRLDCENHKSLVNSYSDSTRGHSCHCSDLGGQISVCDCPVEEDHDVSSAETDTDSCCDDEEPPNYEEAGLLNNIERYGTY